MLAYFRLPVLIEGLAWLLLTVVAVIWSASDYLPDFGGDAAVYWLTANYWSPYTSPLPSAVGIAAISTYPPLYPLLLALLGGGGSIRLAHYITAGTLIGALLCLRWFYRQLGLSRVLSSVLALLVALLPMVRWEGFDLHSEPLYLAFSSAALALAVGTKESDTSIWRFSAIGLLIGCALLTRTIGIAFVGALALLIARQRRWSWVVSLGIAFAAWAYNSLSAHSTSSYWQILHARRDGIDDPIGAMVNALFGGYLDGIIGPDTPNWLCGVSIVMLGLLGVALGYRVYRGFIDGYYVLAYLAVILLWPFPAEAIRFLMPIVPILLGQLAQLLNSASIRIPKPAPLVINMAIPLWLALIVIPDTIRIAVRFATPPPVTMGPGRHSREWYWSDIRDSRQAITQYSAWHVLMARAAQVVPAQECIYAIKPALVSLFTGRQSFMPPLPNVSDQEFDTALAQHKCRYFLMLNMPTPTVPYAMYPYTRIADKLRVISKVTNAFDTSGDGGALAEWITPPGAIETRKATLPATH